MAQWLKGSSCLHRYQSTPLGTFQSMDLIETFVNYHENIRKCVCIVYDPQVGGGSVGGGEMRGEH